MTFIYDDDSTVAITNNNNTIIDTLAAFPLSGGTIILRPGVLHISETIRNPVRWQNPPGSPGWCPINFRIEGKVNSRIKYHGVGPGIQFHPTTPALYPDQGLRLELENFTLEGGGIDLLYGGKFTKLRNLRINGCDLGLNVNGHDGGYFDDIYITRCKTGAKFEKSFMNQFSRFTVRECLEDGLVVDNCAAWVGQLYLESNIGWQGNFNNLRYSPLLNVWAEDHGHGPFRPLIKRRNCQLNCWGGQLHDNRIFDDDPISKLLNVTVTNDEQFPKIGTPVGSATDIAVYAGGPEFVCDGTGLTAICLPGCFGRSVQMYAEIRGFDPTFTHTWKAGDYTEIEVDVVCGQVTRDFCGTSLPFVLNMAGGTFNTKQNVRIDGERTHLTFRGYAVAPGQSIRVFMFLLGMPVNTQEVRFKFENMQVRHLENS